MLPSLAFKAAVASGLAKLAGEKSPQAVAAIGASTWGKLGGKKGREKHVEYHTIIKLQM